MKKIEKCQTCQTCFAINTFVKVKGDGNFIQNIKGVEEGLSEEFSVITVEDIQTGIIDIIMVTPEHYVRTVGGWKAVGNLSLSDKLSSKFHDYGIVKLESFQGNDVMSSFNFDNGGSVIKVGLFGIQFTDQTMQNWIEDGKDLI
jgi:hypothetical protein